MGLGSKFQNITSSSVPCCEETREAGEQGFVVGEAEVEWAQRVSELRCQARATGTKAEPSDSLENACPSQR